MTLAERVHARNLAQKHLEEGVADAFPIGKPVTFEIVGKPFQGVVTGTEGETVLIKRGEKINRRHFEKVS